MKPKNCKAGQRVIIKENDSGIKVGTKGVILEDGGIPYVAILEGDYPEFTGNPRFNYPTRALTCFEIKKDRDYPDLVDIKEYLN